jgi:hypothetical protein
MCQILWKVQGILLSSVLGSAVGSPGGKNPRKIDWKFPSRSSGWVWPPALARPGATGESLGELLGALWGVILTLPLTPPGWACLAAA